MYCCYPFFNYKKVRKIFLQETTTKYKKTTLDKKSIKHQELYRSFITWIYIWPQFIFQMIMYFEYYNYSKNINISHHIIWFELDELISADKTFLVTKIFIWIFSLFKFECHPCISECHFSKSFNNKLAGIVLEINYQISLRLENRCYLFSTSRFTSHFSNERSCIFIKPQAILFESRNWK